MKIKRKKPFFYICVEETRDLDIAFLIYLFLVHLTDAKRVHPPIIKPACIFKDEALLKELKKNFEKIVVVCISRSHFITKGGFVRRSIFYNLKRYLLPSRFALGAFEFKDKQVSVITLSMDEIEKTKASPLATFIHELLHLKREKDCSNKGCTGEGFHRAYGLCKECTKLLLEIAEGKF